MVSTIVSNHQNIAISGLIHELNFNTRYEFVNYWILINCMMMSWGLILQLDTL